MKLVANQISGRPPFELEERSLDHQHLRFRIEFELFDSDPTYDHRCDFVLLLRLVFGGQPLCFDENQ